MDFESKSTAVVVSRSPAKKLPGNRTCLLIIAPPPIAGAPANSVRLFIELLYPVTLGQASRTCAMLALPSSAGRLFPGSFFACFAVSTIVQLPDTLFILSLKIILHKKIWYWYNSRYTRYFFITERGFTFEE